jgi:hypothetical protein
VEVATVSLTRGQVNAVRSAFKAGIKPSRIARQFGVSQSDVRKVLASDAALDGRWSLMASGGSRSIRTDAIEQA